MLTNIRTSSLPGGPNNGADGAAARPPSAIAWPVALTALACVVIALVITVRSPIDPALAAILVMMVGIVPAVIFDGAPKAVAAWRSGAHSASLPRVGVKLVGLAAALCLVAAAVGIFPFFQRPELNAMGAWAPYALVALAPAAVVYVALVDALAPDKEDGLHALGALVLGRPYDLGVLNNFLLAQIVKLLFFTMMLTYFANDIAFFREAAAPRSPFGSLDDFQWWNRLLFTGDVAFAGLGYIATFKLFGWEVREAEPTVAGWAACLICYEPLFPGIERAFLSYHTVDPGAAWVHAPVIGPLWIMLILGCDLVYMLATVAFGPLFSNLTRRGIITSGPYRFTKHPAYLAKNAGWWLYELPAFLTEGVGGAIRRAIMLGCFSAIYIARARCEERLLSRDPVYGAYARYIAASGIFAMLRRRLGALVAARGEGAAPNAG